MRVAIIMGSTSDLPKVEPAIGILKEYSGTSCGDSPHILGSPFQREPFKGALQWPNVNPPPI